MSGIRRHRGMAPFVVVAVLLAGIVGGCGGGGGDAGVPPEAPPVQLPTTIAPTDPARVDVDRDTGLEAARDEILCYLRNPTPEEIARIEAKTGARLVGRVPAVELLQFRLPTGTSLPDVLQEAEELDQDPAVTAVSPNWMLHPTQLYPNDGAAWGFASSDWDIEHPGGPNWGWESIRVPLVWEDTTGDENVKVGIVDTGFQTDHTDLRSNIEEARPIAGATPDPRHGTHVAGIVGALGGNAEGVAGVSYGCKLRCYWFGAEFSIAQAVEGATSALEEGCRAVNYSAGLRWDHVPRGPLDALRRWQVEITWRPVLGLAGRRGAVFVQSAGNGVTKPAHPIHGTPFDARWNAPAGLEPDSESYIVVAASAEDGQLAPWSNFGTCVTVAAPGVDVWSCVPSHTYEALSGTSMAAPFVTGLVALLLSIDPGLSPGEVKHLVEDGARARGRALDGGNFYIMDAWESARRIGGGGEVIISGWLRPR